MSECKNQVCIYILIQSHIDECTMYEYANGEEKKEKRNKKCQTNDIYVTTFPLRFGSKHNIRVDISHCARISRHDLIILNCIIPS